MRPLFGVFCSVLTSVMLYASPASAQIHFTDCVSLTGNNATILIPTSAVEPSGTYRLAEGDELAVFNQDGACAGVAVWRGGNLALPIWGTDPLNSGRRGLGHGEFFTVTLWSSADGVEYAVALSYSTAYPYYRADGAYAEDAMYLVASLNVVGAAPSQTTLKAATFDEAPGTQAFTLSQNYPNPFRRSTAIAYHLATGTQVRLDVINLQGQSVRTLVSQYQTAGDYDFVFDAGDLPSGLYVCRLTAGGTVQTQRMLLLN
jgi:hypothetical protein